MGSVFNDLDHRCEPTEIESMCPSCEETGVTRLLLTKIPFYKEVVLMSFQCSTCDYRNNEVHSSGPVQEQGVKILLNIKEKEDLCRQVVKSEFAAISISAVELEIPQGSQAGEITTVEGIILRTRNSLEQSQEQRKKENPENARKVQEFMEKLDDLLNIKYEFTLILDDPSGNSFIESPLPYQVDPKRTVIHYHRTLQQEKLLGLVDDVDSELDESAPPVWESKEQIKNEVLELKTQCDNCFSPVQAHMKVQEIPYFKEVVIMSTNCDICGHRTAEVKSGTGVADQGLKLNLHVRSREDLVRDVIKSETCSMEIPEFDLKCGMTSLAGRFTTVEGLLAAVKDQLRESSMTFLGDSADQTVRKKMEDLFCSLDHSITGSRPIHLVLDDPAGNSYIQSYSAPQPDENLSVTYYERTFEQNEELGLNDMKTENYEEETESENKDVPDSPKPS